MTSWQPSHITRPTDKDHDETRLVIDAGQHEINVPRVDAALADVLVIDEGNPWYSSDGHCLFSKDGTVLLRCLTNVVRYDVPPTCTAIDDEAFAYNTVLRHITLPDSIVRIGERAFIGSTLDEIAVPASVRSIGAEAFSGGKNLRVVHIEEGVEEIGDEAFSECRALQLLRIPASVRHLGARAFEQCLIRACGSSCGLTIAPDNKDYFIDDRGVLYQRGEQGLTLITAINQARGTYTVLQGTTDIADRAFAYNRLLERIEFPDGLRSIGNRAFLECESLEYADLPQSVQNLGTEAFYHSSLKRIEIPACLQNLGPASLVVKVSIAPPHNTSGTLGGRGANDFYRSALSGRLREMSAPRLSVSVSPENQKFSLIDGLLCESPAPGKPLQAVQFVGGELIARIPPEVTHIAAYALFGVENLKELHLHTGIEQIGHSALDISYPLEMIEVDDGGDEPIRLFPAPNSSGTVAQRKAFRAGWLDLNMLVRDCDSSLSFMMPGHERTWRMLARLVNGQMLSERHQREFTNTVRICLDELIRQFARMDDRQSIRDLLDLGFIDADSIAHSIEVANSAKGVACARLLLEEKEKRFPERRFDFDL